MFIVTLGAAGITALIVYKILNRRFARTCISYANAIDANHLEAMEKAKTLAAKEFNSSTLIIERQGRILSEYDSLIDGYKNILQAKDEIIKSKDVIIERYTEMIDNLSELNDTDSEDSSLSEEPEVVFAHPVSENSNIMEQRVAKANAMITLFEVAQTVESLKSTLPTEAYNKLAKHFRQDS